MRAAVLLLLLAACAEIPQAATAKVCVTAKHDVGARVYITELSGEGTITEILGPSPECRNPALPILAIAKG